MNARELLAHAKAIEAEILRIDTATMSVHARERAVRLLCGMFPRSAVHGIAKLRGCRNIARMVNRL